MLTKTTMQEIQDLKLQGLTQAEIIAHYKDLGIKPPSRPTVAKYYTMDVIPENPGEKLAKDKVFDEEPFRSAILRILENNENKDYCMSSVYDVLEELFIENGEYEKLPGNEQTLRNYIHYLEESGQINRDPGHKRVYDHVFDTPPGDQIFEIRRHFSYFLFFTVTAVALRAIHTTDSGSSRLLAIDRILVPP